LHLQMQVDTSSYDRVGISHELDLG
jgi:hypothetical protein